MESDTDFDAANIMRPASLMPARFRREVETMVMVSLAGDIGAAYSMTDATGYVDDFDEREAERLASTLSPMKPSELPPVEARLLHLAETGSPRVSAFADELLEREVLSSRAIREILREGRGPEPVAAYPRIDPKE